MSSKSLLARMVAALGVALLVPVASSAATVTARVAVDTDAPSVPIGPLMHGGFIEHFHRQIYGGLYEPGSPLSDDRGFRRDVIEALRELKVSVVRWPGGCFASGYHWRDGVGPDRKPVSDPVWGVVDPNTFGTVEFVEWCRRVGCEPYICGNAGNGSPEEMRDWVEYCNASEGPNAELRRAHGHPNPLNVRYWSIGNENWGAHEIGAKTPEEWGPWVAKAAGLMRAADPSIHLLAAATPNRNWTMPLLKTAGDQLEFVAIHEYWLPCWQDNITPDYVACIMKSEGPEKTVSRVVDLLGKAHCRGRVRIAFDEWNLRGWHHPGFPRKAFGDPADPVTAELIQNRDKSDMDAQYTMADALFSASFMNACLRHAGDVAMTNIAPIVNTRGPLRVHPHGVVKRSTFHALSMYANALESRVGQIDVRSDALAKDRESVPVVDAVATVDESGRNWALVLVNRHPSEPATCTVRMKNAALEGDRPAVVLKGGSPDDFNDAEHPDRVVPENITLTFTHGATVLPPHSLTVVKVRLDG